jgi:ribose 5-phosphate isomerase B
MFGKNEIIAIGCDHAGYELKELLVSALREWGYELKDFGTFSEESVDYPDVVHPLASAVNEGIYHVGIVICGSGNGVAMVANKYPNVRAALCWKPEIAELARRHNNANILALPGRFLSGTEAAELTKLFLTTGFDGGRHVRRVNKIPNKPC